MDPPASAAVKRAAATLFFQPAQRRLTRHPDSADKNPARRMPAVTVPMRRAGPTDPMNPPYARTAPRPGFLSGALHAPRAAAFLLAHPSLWPWCVAPILINIAVLAGVWIWTGHLAAGWLADLAAREGWMGHALAWLAWAFALLLRVLVSLVTLVVVGNVASAPFSDFLSERVDRIVSNWRESQPFSASRLVRQFVRTPVLEIRRTAAYAAIMLPLLFLSFVPLLSPLTVAAQFLVSAAFLALDAFSYPLERRGRWRLREKAAVVRANMAPSLGFGATMAALGLVPLVNFLFIPIGVVGGTLLFLELEPPRAGADR